MVGFMFYQVQNVQHKEDMLAKEELKDQTRKFCVHHVSSLKIVSSMRGRLLFLHCIKSGLISFVKNMLRVCAIQFLSTCNNLGDISFYFTISQVKACKLFQNWYGRPTNLFGKYGEIN